MRTTFIMLNHTPSHKIIFLPFHTCNFAAYNTMYKLYSSIMGVLEIFRPAEATRCTQEGAIYLLGYVLKNLESFDAAVLELHGLSYLLCQISHGRCSLSEVRTHRTWQADRGPRVRSCSSKGVRRIVHGVAPVGRITSKSSPLTELNMAASAWERWR